MTTPNNFGWYYVAVLVLLLFGQQYLMGHAHTEAMAKLKAQHQEQIAKLTAAQPAATTVASAAPAPAAPAAPAVSATPTPVPAPAGTPATLTPAKDMRTTEIALKDAPKKPEAKSGIGTIFASAVGSKPKATAAGAAKVPVKVTFRSEPFEKGKIVLVTNTSKQKLDCKVAVTRPQTGERKTFTVSVAPSTEMRLAGAQGWAFKSGDRIQIAEAGYAPQSASVP